MVEHDRIPEDARVTKSDLALRLRNALRAELTAHDEGDADQATLAELAAAPKARIKGSWRHLKICPAGDCLWGFYDTSRNHSRRWCSMEVCGNRNKVRAFRGRSRD